MTCFYENNSNSFLEAEVAKLRHELKLLVGKKEVCAMCSSSMHTIKACPHNPVWQEVTASRIYSQNRVGYSNMYNLGWRDHPNFSWTHQLGQSSMIPQFEQRIEPKKPCLEDMFARFIHGTQASIQKLCTQLGQIANVVNERSQTEVNPRGMEHAKAIRTLRSSKSYGREDKDVILGDERVKDTSVVPPSSQEETDQLIPPSAPPVAPLKERVYIPPLPFPQQFQKQKKDRHMLDIMELFKKVHINIPLLDAIKQIPSYAKFLKDVCTNKRKFAEHERVMLNEERSVVLLNKLPPKLKDPGSFTIPCVIGNL
ncbi:uncharacterized protein LOC119982204 isoform X1 [Tripterygium wilfordii]|uniref:uncharacterized protein LOC119982204 isoform X1 n=1 Tax=Tripterygium wilfordii TaxID=458696 RepID=UPI0018F84085|nr:uncharacterized protein LOC119982204 isoform X1 [Tripterygium wilfordii]